MQGLQRRNKSEKEDRQLFEMMRIGGGMVYRSQKILQIKTVELNEEESSDEFEEGRRFVAYNPQIKQVVDPNITQPNLPTKTEELVLTEAEKKKRRKKPRRKKKFDKDDTEQPVNEDSSSTYASQSEPIDQQFE